ncbi:MULTISPECIES: hypothetical protein [unclassified Streptomyces]|uniref:hypothetical protein n=1 Tax=unclassified Streptomyces TaxID=2593676 RepID=UPI0021C7BFB0|nr:MULTISPECIES: hypothetical protein [unclassified Streptomyces]
MSRQHDDEKPGSVAVGFSGLGDRRFNGYLRVRIPHELDNQVEASLCAYMDSPESIRRTTIDDVNGHVAAVFSAYGQRMASIAVRTRSVEALGRGLVAVGLAEGHLDDPRDNLFVLAAVNDAASLIGTSLHRLIIDKQGLLPSDGLAGIQDFDRRKTSEKSIESMGIRRVGDEQSFLYV